MSKVTETSESEQAGKTYARDELKKSAKLSWTDKAKAEILAAKGGASPSPSEGGGSDPTPSPVPTNNGDDSDGD